MAVGAALGEAFVEIGANLSPLRRGLGSALSMVKGMGASMAAAGATAGLAVGAAIVGGIGAAAAGGVYLASLGSDLQELTSKFNNVFGDSADSARKWAAEFGGAVGRSEVELQGMLANMQALMKPMGFSTDEAAKLSTTMTQLAVDIGSFSNASDEDVMAALKSGLMGEAEPLKQYGVVLNDVALDSELMAMGIKGGSDAASEQQKIMARLAIIMRSTKDAQGDAAETADSLANRWKGLKGDLFDLGSRIGEALVPAATSVVAAFGGITDWLVANMSTFQAWGSYLGSVLTSAVNWFLQLGATVISFVQSGDSMFGNMSGNVGNAFTYMKEMATWAFGEIKSWVESAVFVFLNWDLVVRGLGIKLAEAFTNMVGRVQNFATNTVILFQWVGKNWSEIIFTVLDLILTGMINLGTNIRTLWAAIMESIASGSMAPIQQAWQNEMKGLLDGAVSTVSEMPQFQPYVATDAFKDQLSELDKEWEDRFETWNTALESNAPKMGEAVANGVSEGMKSKFAGEMSLPDIVADPLDPSAQKKKGKSGAGSTTSLSSAFDKVQEAALQGKDDMAKRQLKATEQIAKNTDPKRQPIRGPQVAVAG